MPFFENKLPYESIWEGKVYFKTCNHFGAFYRFIKSRFKTLWLLAKIRICKYCTLLSYFNVLCATFFLKSSIQTRR